MVVCHLKEDLKMKFLNNGITGHRGDPQGIMKKLLVVFFCTVCFLLSGEDKFPPIITVPGEFDAVHGHIQGICASQEAIYLSCQTGIFKINWQGKLLKYAKVVNHTGDLCFHNGKVYSSVAYYDTARKGKGAIIEYSADLEELRRFELDFPIDGIAVMDGYFYFGAGPNPRKSHRGNKLARLAADFSGKIEFIKIDHGYPTRFGTQAITTWGNQLFASFYGASTPWQMASFDRNGKTLKVLKFNGNYGFEALPGNIGTMAPRFLRLSEAYNRKKKESPRFRLDFYEYQNGGMVNLSAEK